MQYTDAFGIWIKSTLNQSWLWFNTLSIEESFVVLGLTAVAGLLCMRGFGSRKHH